MTMLRPARDALCDRETLGVLLEALDAEELCADRLLGRFLLRRTQRTHDAHRSVPPAGAQHAPDDRLRLFLDAAQVVAPRETLGVQLVDVLGAGWAGGKPPVLGNYLQSPNGSTVSRGVRQATRDPVARESRGRDLVRR